MRKTFLIGSLLAATMTASGAMAGSYSDYYDMGMPKSPSHIQSGFYLGATGFYSRSVLDSSTSTSNVVSIKHPGFINNLLGYGARAGYNVTLDTPDAFLGAELGYQYLGRLIVTDGSSTKNYSLQMGTVLANLGVAFGRVSLMLKGGIALEIGGQAKISDTEYYYNRDTTVAPMAGVEVGFALDPNWNIEAGADYIFGKKLNTTTLGHDSPDQNKTHYGAWSALMGVSYYFGNA